MVGRREGPIEIGERSPLSMVKPMRVAVREAADQVAPAKGGGIDPEPSSGDVDKALDDVVRLRLARSPIGVDRRGIGEHAADVHARRAGMS